MVSLSLVLLLSLLSIPTESVVAKDEDNKYTGCMIQHEDRWLKYSFNGGTLPATGCGIFALVNCVGYLTGETMDVVEAATWAHNIGGYNVYGADGTYCLVLYPRVEAKYGSKYNIKVDCGSDKNGYWENASSSRLKNHIKKGGVAIAHVPGHFIAIVGYDEASGRYHVYDSSPSPKRGTNVNGGDLWVSETNLSLNVFKLDWFCLISSEEQDKQKPVISNVTYSDVSASGYTIKCEVTDDYYVGNVAFPTWTEKDGQDDLLKNAMVTQTGTREGNTFTYKVLASKHKGETEGYITHIYATDRGGNVSVLKLDPVDMRKDKEKPVISDVSVTNRTKDGFTISCKVTDDWGINHVSFPSWTETNGQDDLADNFLLTQLGTKDGDIYSFRVNTSQHGNELGDYIVHIYGVDCAGNTTKYEYGAVSVKDPAESILLRIPSEYKVNGSMVCGVPASTSVKALISQFENKGLTVTNKNGEVIAEDGVAVSGGKISLGADGKVVDSLTLVISGDIDGDGKVSESDIESFKTSLLTTAFETEWETAAADMDNDEVLDVTDYINVRAKAFNI
jgi:hypothetical protein